MSLVYAIADPHSDDGRVLRAVRETLSAAAQARRAALMIWRMGLSMHGIVACRRRMRNDD